MLRSKRGTTDVSYETKKKCKEKHTPIGTHPIENILYCDEGYGLIKYKSDRFGLRNNDSNWDNILKHEAIFLVGDSFTHGACVEVAIQCPRN